MFATTFDLTPLLTMLVGLSFIVVVAFGYRITLAQVAGFFWSVHKTTRRVALAAFNQLRKMIRWVLKLIADSWQFIAGIAFTLVALIGFVALSGISFEIHQPQQDSARRSLAGRSSRNIIDTSRAWVYDFSTQPNGTPDRKLWNIETGTTKADYNNELETYTRRTNNVRVQDGVLVLEARIEQRDGKNYTSGRIDTNGSFSFVYGTLEVEAKLPRGVGTWPAAWLIPVNPRYQAKDFPNATNPTRLWTLNGELDFLEAVGYLPGQNIPAAHSYNSLGRAPINTPAFITNPYDGYHRYGIIKTKDSVTFTIDGEEYARREKTSSNPLEWPFDQGYYLVLNLAIGGYWAGRYGVDDTSIPWQYKIKSVRYEPLAS